ncbi:MAG: metalloregulator ArsR/SmtB family transcription factor [Alphaproteobacteria bacterium]|nr:metalloregulator ArsR/SmtB family transcription factor [Alphaproteobacteria bacterium]
MQTDKSIGAMKQNAKKAEALLKLMANAKRLMILCHLSRREMTVNELMKLVGLSQSALSQHLAKMRLEKLVAGEKRGQSVYYRIAKPEAEALLSTLYLIYCRP